MNQRHTFLFFILICVAGIAWGSFAPHAQAESNYWENSSNSSIFNDAKFHFDKVNNYNEPSDFSEHSDATMTTRLENRDSQDREQEQEDNNENENNHADTSNSESNAQKNSAHLKNYEIPTTLQGILDFLQQLKEQVLALLAQITGHTTKTSFDISSIMATNITPSSAVITWTTNQIASGKVYVSTSTPVLISIASSTSDTNFVVNHSVLISNLSASTTYYYVVESTNANGIIERSDTYSFTTPQNQELSISGVNIVASSLTASSVVVQWATSISASSRVYVSTSTPVITTSATFIEDPTLVITHALTLNGLTANTTYYYIAESKDINGNVVQSAQKSFITR